MLQDDPLLQPLLVFPSIFASLSLSLTTREMTCAHYLTESKDCEIVSVCVCVTRDDLLRRPIMNADKSLADSLVSQQQQQQQEQIPASLSDRLISIESERVFCLRFSLHRNLHRVLRQQVTFRRSSPDSVSLAASLEDRAQRMQDQVSRCITDNYHEKLLMHLQLLQ